MFQNARVVRRAMRRAFEYAVTISIGLLCAYGIVHTPW